MFYTSAVLEYTTNDDGTRYNFSSDSTFDSSSLPSFPPVPSPSHSSLLSSFISPPPRYVKNNCSFVSWGVCVRRHSSYYMVKICVMLWLTTILSCATYFFPATNLGNKIESLVGCFTAVIAFLFVINDKLPKTPFLHKVRKERSPRQTCE